MFRSDSLQRFKKGGNVHHDNIDSAPGILKPLVRIALSSIGPCVGANDFGDLNHKTCSPRNGGRSGEDQEELPASDGKHHVRFSERVVVAPFPEEDRSHSPIPNDQLWWSDDDYDRFEEKYNEQIKRVSKLIRGDGKPPSTTAMRHMKRLERRRRAQKIKCADGRVLLII